MAKAKKTAALTFEERLEQALVPEGEQPYPVPENWCWVKGSILLHSMETQRPQGEVFKYIDIDAIDNENQVVKTPKHVFVKDAPSRASRKLHNGDTIFSMVRPYLKNIAYIDDILSDCIASTGFYVCTPIQAVNKRFFFHLMISHYVVDGLNKSMKGDNSPSIRKEDIEVFSYPLPPLAEQRRIVVRIESLFAKLDEAKEKAQAALDSFETRKAAILHKAFTGKLTAKWREENCMGMDSWKNVCLKDCISKLGDGLHGTPSYDESGEFYFINGNNFSGKEIEIKDNTKRVNKLEFQKNRKSLDGSTVFVSINGTLGKTAFYNNEPIILGKSACYFNVTQRLVKEFIRYYLESSTFTKYAHEKATGSTIKNLSLKAMRDLPLDLPHILEQEEIVRLLDTFFAKEQKAKELCSVVNNIDLIKKSILARAFRGELGTNDPTEESAVELLKSIV